MFNWLEAIQVLIIISVVYIFYIRFIKNTSSEKLVRGLIGLGILWLMSFVMMWLHLNLFGRFLYWVALFISIGLIVVFQPELRKFLSLLGNIHKWKDVLKLFSVRNNKNHIHNSESVEEIMKAVEYMSEKHTGALIVFAEPFKYESLIERKGTEVDAKISSEVLLTIFFNKTPLHDGAIIISDNRIAYAGAILPLSQNSLHWKYGTRHRAALGMAENSSAVILVVSEETGDISIAEKGNIKKYDDMKKLKTRLEKVI